MIIINTLGAFLIFLVRNIVSLVHTPYLELEISRKNYSVYA